MASDGGGCRNESSPVRKSFPTTSSSPSIAIASSCRVVVVREYFAHIGKKCELGGEGGESFKESGTPRRFTSYHGPRTPRRPVDDRGNPF
jgi:hypothetical protein